MNAPLAPIELDLLAIEPRPCELCGLTIERHDIVDDGDGPLFYCPDLSPDDMTLEELERRAELRRQEDVAAILAAMPECPSIAPVDKPPEPYRPAQSTADAFFFVARSQPADYLGLWLAEHPQDAPHLHKLWIEKCCQTKK